MKWRRTCTTGLLTAALLVAAGRPAVAGDVDDAKRLLRATGEAFAAVAERALPAVVSVRVERTIRAPGQSGPHRGDPFGLYGDELFRQFFFHGQPQPEREFRQQGQGSGFLISKDGYILTNHHVVGDADRIRVRMSDGREFDAKRIGSDARSDVALIRIEGDDFPHVAIGNSDTLRVGEWVIAIGNPFELGETVTVGVVSAKGRSRTDIADYVDFIQTDAAINPGNSGGPLLNLDGDVVGINTAIYSASGGYMGIGFAIPIATATGIKDQLMNGGVVRRGYLGIRIQDLTPELAEHFATAAGGIVITHVEPDSPAEKGGLEMDDVMVKLNGEDVGSVSAFRNRVANTAPDTTLSLTLLRDGVQRTLKVKTGTLDGATAVEGDEADAGISATRLGLEVGPLLVDPRRGASAPGGVQVVGVTPDGPAARAGLQPGDVIMSVNRQSVDSPEEFRQALAANPNARSVLLKMARGAYATYLVVQLD